MPAGDELRGRGAAQKAGAANHKYVQDSLSFFQLMCGCIDISLSLAKGNVNIWEQTFIPILFVLLFRLRLPQHPVRYKAKRQLLLLIKIREIRAHRAATNTY